MDWCPGPLTTVNMGPACLSKQSHLPSLPIFLPSAAVAQPPPSRSLPHRPSSSSPHPHGPRPQALNCLPRCRLAVLRRPTPSRSPRIAHRRAASQLLAAAISPRPIPASQVEIPRSPNPFLCSVWLASWRRCPRPSPFRPINTKEALNSTSIRRFRVSLARRR